MKKEFNPPPVQIYGYKMIPAFFEFEPDLVEAPPFIDLPNSPQPIRSRFEQVFDGLIASAKTINQLDQAALTISRIFGQISLEEIYTYYPEFCWSTLKTNGIPMFSASFIEKRRDKLWIHYIDQNNRQVTLDRLAKNPDKQSIKQKAEELDLTAPIMKVFKEVLKNPNPEAQARAIYTLFQVENPLLKIPDAVFQVVGKLYSAQSELENAVVLCEDEKKSVFKNVAYFLTEVGFSTEVNWLNAWGYAQHTCQALIEMLKDDYLGPRLSRDFFSFGQKKPIYCPPQIYFMFEELMKNQGKVYTDDNYTQVLTSALKDFYKSHPEGLADHDVYGQPNYTVAGLNRIYENPDALEAISEDGQALILFCGPLAAAQLEVARASQLSGHQLTDNICVDSRPNPELHSIKTGGRSLFIKNELLSGQRPTQILADARVSEHLNGVKHIQAVIPEQTSQIESELKNPVYIADKRGSLLYLQGEKLLEHLTWVCQTARPGTVIHLSKGLSRWIVTDLVLQKQTDGSLKIIDTVSVFKQSEKARSKSSVYSDNLWAYNKIGLGSNRYSRLTKKIFKDWLLEPSLKSSFLSLSLYQQSALRDAFLHGFLKLIDINYRNSFPSVPLTQGEKTSSLYFETLITQGKSEADNVLKSHTGEKMLNSNKPAYDLLIQILLAIDEVNIHQLVSEVAEEIGINTSLQGLLYPVICEHAWKKIISDNYALKKLSR